MPRLPRVTSTACMPVRRSSARPARSSASGSSSIRTPSACSTSDSFGVHAVRPRYAVRSYRESTSTGTGRRRERRATAARIASASAGVTSPDP